MTAYDYRWASPPRDPDACRKRGHGTVVCQDCGTVWPTPCQSCGGTGHSGNLHDELCPDCAGARDEARRDDAVDAKREDQWMRERAWDDADRGRWDA
jgi:DnaJ-class molecular chaperone